MVYPMDSGGEFSSFKDQPVLPPIGPRLSPSVVMTVIHLRVGPRGDTMYDIWESRAGQRQEILLSRQNCSTKVNELTWHECAGHTFKWKTRSLAVSLANHHRARSHNNPYSDTRGPGTKRDGVHFVFSPRYQIHLPTPILHLEYQVLCPTLQGHLPPRRRHLPGHRHLAYASQPPRLLPPHRRCLRERGIQAYSRWNRTPLLA